MSNTHKTRAFSRGPRLSVGGVDQLADALRAGSYGSFEARSPFAATLFPLLKALQWRGTLRELFEALPHFASALELPELRNVLALLGYATHSRPVKKLADLDPRLFPCIFVDAAGGPHILFEPAKVGPDGAGVESFSGDQHKEQVLDGRTPGTAYLITPLDGIERESERPGKKAKPHPEGWFSAVVHRFDKVIWRLLGITFFINLLALSVPLFILSVYDQVVPIRATDVLFGLSIGVALAFIFDLMLRLLRSRLIALIGARMENIIAVSTFEKILGLPSSMTESAPLGDQVAKVRDFDSLRDIFTSLLVTVGLELPFVVIFLAVLALFAGVLALVPLAMAVLYAVIWFILAPKLRASVKEGSRIKARRHSFLVEAISNMRTIKEASVEDIWKDRYRNFSAECALAHHKSAQLSFLFQTFGQAVMLLSGLATLAVGVQLAINSSISMGALIAAMVLTWRILNPIQNLFLTFARAEQTKVAIAQINNLMKINSEERHKKQSSGVERAWQGGLRFNRVSLRYNPHGEPALLGVSFAIKPGDFLAVSGSNGSGKSSIARLLLGLTHPQAGQITLDGVDIRQIAPAELRSAVAYVPQKANLFHGSISQNLRLGNPVASDKDIRNACEMAGVLKDIEALPDGFNTRVGDQNVWQINSGLRQKLSLARAYACDAPVLLMDEPASALDDDGDAALMKTLSALHYKKTIVMVSHRPSHIRLADQLIMLHRGSVQASGTPDEVLKKIAKKR